MKKMISICLVLVLAGGFILTENTRAEAIDPASAALIATTFIFLPVIASLSAHEHEHYRHAPSYEDARYDMPYQEQARVYYSYPGRDVYYYDSGYRDYGYKRDYRSHRGDHEDRRFSDRGRERYARRHHRDGY